MTRKCTRLLWLLVAALLLIGCLAGCATDPAESADPSAESTAQTTGDNGEPAPPGDSEPEQTDPSGNPITPDSSSADSSPATPGSNGGQTAGTTKGGGNSSGNSGSNSTTKASSGIDMGGYEFILGTVYYTNYLNDEGVLDPTYPIVKAINKVEKAYNCKVKFYKFTDISSAGNQIVTAVKGGDRICDVAQLQFSRCRTVAYNNACHDLKTLKTLDLNSGSFEAAITDAFTFNKKVYAVNFGFNANVQGLFYNAAIVKQYAPQYDPYTMYKKGTWTEDKFYEMLSTISTASGGKIIPLTGTTGVMALSAAVNAGGTSYKSGNKVTFGIVTSNGIKALNYVKKLYNEKLWSYDKDNSTVFNTGKAAFVESAIWRHKTYSSINNLEFVPWPKGELKKYVIPTADGIAWCVPKTVKKKDYVGTILNALGEASSEMINQEIRKLEDNGWSAHSMEIAKWTQQNHQIDMTTGPDISTFSEKIDNAVFQANMQPAAAMQSIATAAQKAFDDYYNQFIR